MGQHKNNAQVEIFIKFMEQHKDLARGFMKGDRVHCEKLWADLAMQLNASGPPSKDVAAWKKVWVDMKLGVKNRMAHNKAECSRTGGGQFNKYILSTSDEQVAAICGLYASVEGVEGSKSYGIPCSVASKSSDSPIENASPGITYKSINSPPSPKHNELPIAVTTPVRPNCRKRKREIDVADVMEHEAEHFSKIAKNLENIKDEMKENRNYFREVSKNIRELKKLKELELKELTRHNRAMEKSAQTKNELKLKFLELEQLKLGIQTSPTSP